MNQARENFIRLAKSRVTKTIHALRLVGNLSNRSNYSYSDDDIEKIFKTLEAELKLARRRFEDSKARSSKASFEL